MKAVSRMYNLVMNKVRVLLLLLVLVVLVVLGALILLRPFKSKESNESGLSSKTELLENIVDETTPTATMPNPASKYCEENGGDLEIISNKDGSQFGMCKLDNYSCEEWAYSRGECNIEGDAEKIREALVAKGLDLTGMKVVITRHLGNFIGGSVLPVSMLGGGGYVFAVKEGSEVKVLADGNGAIMCSYLEDHPDYPSYLISECVDAFGNSVSR